MSRTVQELEQDLVSLWGLVTELSEQLSANQAQVIALKNQAGDVKGQAVHTGTGFPLRRFNIDISDGESISECMAQSKADSLRVEQFATEIERFASHVVLENQGLQYENKQLNLLLKEFEGTMQDVMQKFRAICAAATEHELKLHHYYTNLIAQLQTSHSTSTLLDSTTLSTLLTRLSVLIRAALRNLNGEDDPGFELPQSSDLNKTIEAIASSSSWLGDQGSGGGYSGTQGRRDWALEREGEISRLEEENRMLRDMLGISNDVDLAQMTAEAVEQARKEDREARERDEQMVMASKPPASPPREPLSRSASSPAVNTERLSLSPTSSKTSLPGTSPPTPDKITSPTAPLSSLFLRAKTNATTAITKEEDGPTSPTTSRRSSLEGRQMAPEKPEAV